MKHYLSFFVGFFVGVLSCFVFDVFVFGLGVLALLAMILNQKFRWWFLFVMFGLFVGGVRCVVFDQFDEKNSVLSLIGEKKSFFALVSEVDSRSEFRYLVLDVFADSSLNNPLQGRLQVKVERFPIYRRGDLLKIEAEVSLPKKFDNFDYPAFLRMKGVFAVAYSPQIKLLKHGEAWSLDFLREDFETRINKLLAEPFSGLMAGLLIGSKRNISQEILEDFKATGLTHIVTVSGFNITILVVFINAVFAFLPKFWRLVFSVILIVFFVLFVGASPGVLRAGIMGFLAVFAAYIERLNVSLIALCWSGFLMVLVNPWILIFDIGFQLSFLAVLSLILVMPIFAELKFFDFLPERFGFKEAFLTALAAQVFVLPVILINFKEFSVIAPLANVFVVPLIPLVMLAGFLMLLSSIVLPPVSLVFVFFVWLLVSLILLIIAFFAALPGIVWTISWFDWYLAAYYYALTLYLVLILKRRFQISYI
jgi:competence protein ComEC